MIKRFVKDVFLAAGVIVGGKVLVDYAEKNPKLKIVKDKICKTGKDFSENCKELGKSIADVFRSDESNDCGN